MRILLAVLILICVYTAMWFFRCHGNPEYPFKSLSQYKCEGLK